MKTFALFAAAAAVTVMADAGDSNKAAPKLKPFESPEWGSHEVCAFVDIKFKAKPKAKLTEQYCGSRRYCRLFDDKAKLDKLIAEEILEVPERYNNETECTNAREPEPSPTSASTTTSARATDA